MGDKVYTEFTLGTLLSKEVHLTQGGTATRYPTHCTHNKAAYSKAALNKVVAWTTSHFFHGLFAGFTTSTSGNHSLGKHC